MYYVTVMYLLCILPFSGNIRNLAMEKVASTIMFPCKYSSSGCSLSLLHTEKVEHEELCEWRPYTCPCPGASCKWQGGLEQVMAHLMMSHKSITTLQGNLFRLVVDFAIGFPRLGKRIFRLEIIEVIFVHSLVFLFHNEGFD